MLQAPGGGGGRGRGERSNHRIAKNNQVSSLIEVNYYDITNKQNRENVILTDSLVMRPDNAGERNFLMLFVISPLQ